MRIKILSETLPNIPWEARPENNCDLPLWRYSGNPVIDTYPVKGITKIYNSGAVAFGNELVGVFRCDTHTLVPKLHMGKSTDGIKWEIDEKPIVVTDKNGKPVSYNYAYDPRCVKVDDTYYMIFCTDNHGATIGLVETKDFKKFTAIENPFLPFNRNGVLFPRKIGGNYVMLSRPSDSGHTPFGDIFLSESPDLVYWGKHRHVMSKSNLGWENLKIGGGCAPIETDMGWLLIYHGVTQTCNGYVYSIGGAILDVNNPSKVLYRSKDYLLTPSAPYEHIGQVPNVAFPCSALVDKEGKIAIYYGAADTYLCLAFGTVDEICDYIVKHNEL